MAKKKVKRVVKRVKKEEKPFAPELEQVLVALALACRVKPSKLALLYKDERVKGYWDEFVSGCK